MMNPSIIPPPAWLALATAGWYIASRTLCGTAAGSRGRLAVFALTLPFATTCLAAVLLRHPEVAIGVLLAGSVAAMTLVLGLIGATQPIRPLITPQKSWLFVLPTALVALLIGFSGEIRWSHAVILLLQGVAVWLGRSSLPTRQTRPAATLTLAGSVARVISIFAMLIASILAVSAANSISLDLQQPGGGLIAAVMLAPALVLPMIGLCTRLAGEGKSIEAISLVVQVVLINLCLLLPTSVMTWIAEPRAISVISRSLGVHAATQPTSQPATNPSESVAEIIHFTYPISVWRIDTTLLIVAGIFVLLLALGRVQLGRVESGGLILIYVAYLMLTAIAAR